jgi:hypothetical protein
MTTATNIINHQTLPLTSQRALAIHFKDLRVNDILLIGTQNSCYRFVITCEKKMHGRLSGNPHNGLSCEAVLMGALVIHGEHLHTLISRLEPQSQALFFVQQGDKLLNLLTSVITTLSCIRPVEE